MEGVGAVTDDNFECVIGPHSMYQTPVTDDEMAHIEANMDILTAYFTDMRSQTSRDVLTVCGFSRIWHYKNIVHMFYELSNGDRFYTRVSGQALLRIVNEYDTNHFIHVLK